MSLEANKEIARKHLIEVWSEGHVELIPQIYDMESSANEDDKAQNMKDSAQWWHKICPDLHWTLLNMIAEGDQVMLHWRVDATYTVVSDPPPSFPFLPFGKPISFEGVDIVQIANGKIISKQNVGHWMEMLVKEGVYTLAQAKPA